jgi:hypothetical protein
VGELAHCQNPRHQATGEMAAAREELIEIVKTFSGEEASVALAQLLEKMGAKEDAQAIYQDIVNRAKHAPKFKRVSANGSILQKHPYFNSQLSID